ncbi:MAG: cytochrome c oxidase assembly protein [Parvibaculum sp.]|nr:cytochrome c oxidase assembly protein [Parvibaculum sp.]
MKNPAFTIRWDMLPSVLLSLAIVSLMTAAVAYSPTLYKMFCEATGYGGAVSVARSLDTSKETSGVGPEIEVRFDTNVSSDLNWEFQPEQRTIKTHIGLPTTVYFTAKNLEDKEITARATYNVTPDVMGYYFSKVQCFCFTEEKLAPGETARMPVVFFVDPEMLTDVESKSIRSVTLSYSFFRQADEKTAAARPLREGSEQQVEDFKTAKEAVFEPIEQMR